MRAGLPRLLRSTAPLELAVDAVVRGIVHREARVFAPRHVSLALALRWWLWRVVLRDARRVAPEIERLCELEIERAGSAARVPTSEPGRRPAHQDHG
jgi:hypothetical protein